MGKDDKLRFYNYAQGSLEECRCYIILGYDLSYIDQNESDMLMQEIEETIGEDIDTYRVAHLGMCPVASLIHGFGTIDGYSNNYPLSYKHEFREIIKDELELSEFNKAYFDDWGNRCYLLYHEWANSYMLSKYYQGSVDDLHLNFDKMKEMNCKYIFSAVPITDCEQYGLEFMGAFDSNISYWRVYLYKID